MLKTVSIIKYCYEEKYKIRELFSANLPNFKQTCTNSFYFYFFIRNGFWQLLFLNYVVHMSICLQRIIIIIVKDGVAQIKKKLCYNSLHRNSSVLELKINFKF